MRDNNVVLFQSPPYSMHNVGARTLKGNDAFEGYTIDLIEAVARILSKFLFLRFGVTITKIIK